MAYTDLQLLRIMLSDPFKTGYDEIVADGETDTFRLTHRPVKEGDTLSVTVGDSDQTVGEDFDMDYEDGLLTFSETPEAEALVEVQYQYSVFSDEELTNFLELDGSVKKAQVRCLEILLADSARMFDYTAGLTDVKASQVFNNLFKLLEKLKAEVASGDSTVRIFKRSSYKYGHTADEKDFMGVESSVTSGDLTRDDL